MPPIGGYYPTGPGYAPITPEQSEAMAKQVVAAFKVAFPDPAVLHKGEITAIKNELNALNVAVNGIKGEFNIVSAQTDLVRLESKPLFDLQEYLAGKKGEKPEQLKAAAAAAQKKADDAHQLTQKSLRRVNQIDSALQRAVTGRVIPLGAQVTKLDQNLSARITQLDKGLRTRIAQLDRRVVIVTQDSAAAARLARSANQNAGTALRKANQVGTGVQQAITARLRPISQSISTLRGQLDTARKALDTRIDKVEKRAAATNRTDRAKSNEALRREGDRTRKAVQDLENAVNGTGRVMNQFSQRLRAIEQSLR